MRYKGPKPPTPEPLKGEELNSFAHYTITQRFPRIARQTIKDNEFQEAMETLLLTLIEEIPFAPIRHLHDIRAPDADDWRNYVDTYVKNGDEQEGSAPNWLQIPWFFVETYFYRRILEATGYFDDLQEDHLDPFVRQKSLGLDQQSTQIQYLASLLNQQDRHPGEKRREV